MIDRLGTVELRKVAKLAELLADDIDRADAYGRDAWTAGRRGDETEAGEAAKRMNAAQSRAESYRTELREILR